MPEHLVTHTTPRNTWRIALTPEGDMGEGDGWYSVRFALARLDGDRWDLCIEGQVKHGGCSDWGFGKQVMLHGCCREDMDIFGVVHDEAMKIIKESQA